jgi:hypothetical protein
MIRDTLNAVSFAGHLVLWSVPSIKMHNRPLHARMQVLDAGAERGQHVEIGFDRAGAQAV